MNPEYTSDRKGYDMHINGYVKEELDIAIMGIRLLTVDEAECLDRSVLANSTCWWLNTPGEWGFQTVDTYGSAGIRLPGPLK